MDTVPRLLKLQGDRLRRLRSLMPSMSFKKTSLQDAFDMEIQRHKDNENWTHATPNAKEFKDTLAKRVMIMCRQCSVAGRRVPPPKWYNIIFEGHEDRCGDDEENPSEESDDGVIDVEDATGDEEGANKKNRGPTRWTKTTK